MSLKASHYAEALDALTDRLGKEHRFEAEHFKAIAETAIEMKWKLEELRNER